jgi:hypothetical protein
MSSSPDDVELSPIHRIIRIFSRSMEALGHPATPQELERWSVLVDEAMAGRARLFHSHEHIFELTREADPVESLAALFHDLVYVQVDQGVPTRVASALATYFHPEPGGYVLLEAPAEDKPGQLVYHVFGVQPGMKLTPYTGLNETASALVAARELWPRLPLALVAEVAAGIEATIPFRSRDERGATPFDRLAERLRSASERFGLGLSEEAVSAALRRAIRVSHRDVESFGYEDPALFLDKTWKLLPETNPALRVPDVYTLHDYRAALQKMEGFLSTLTPERIFYQYEDEPTEQEHQAVLARARRNLDLAVRYLRAKLYPVAMLEALAVVTGGDAPMELFTGGIPQLPGGGEVKRLAIFLPPPEDVAVDQEPTVRALLTHGRASETPFDLKSSPTAAYLYRRLGEGTIMAAVGQARQFFKGELGARDFLRLQPRESTVAVIRAVAQVASTRRAIMEALAAELEAGG